MSVHYRCHRGWVGLDDVQAAYDEAVRRLWTDLGTSLLNAKTMVQEICVDFTEPDLQYSYVDTESRHSMSLPMVEDVEEATVALANPLQDNILDLLGGQTWPPCPGHSHPAEPALESLVAVWRCPTTGKGSARIGEL